MVFIGKSNGKSFQSLRLEALSISEQHLMKKYYFKTSIFAFFLVCLNVVQAQELSFHHGTVEFYTSSIMSDIEATSEEVNVKLNVSTRAVEIKIPINSFEFEYEMMQEHFNEEYLESDKFPEATFKGKITQDISNLSETLEVDVIGKLTIHGVEKETQFKATLLKTAEFTVVKCKFPVAFKDFNVEEPSILTKSVATDVEIKSTLFLN